jgi:O-antigen/teichoic acid export membrane protein
MQTKRFLSDTVMYGIAQALTGLRDLILLPFFAVFADEATYGIYTQVSITVALLTQIALFRLDIASVRFLAAESDPLQFRRRYSGAFVWVMGAGLVLALAIVAGATWGAQLVFGSVEYAQYLAPAAAMLVASAGIAFLQNYYRIVQRIGRLSLLTVVQTVAELTAVAAGFWLGGRLELALWLVVVARLLILAYLLAVVTVQQGWAQPAWSLLQPMLRYSVPLMPNIFSQWAVSYADRIVIMQVLGPAAVGVYSAAYSLGQALVLVYSPLGFVLFPLATRAWDEGKRQHVGDLFSQVTRYYLLLAIPASVGLTMLAEPLFQLLTRNGFVIPTVLVFWVAVGVAIKGLYQINVYVFHLVHKTVLATIILAVSTALNILLNVVLVPIVGVTGAAVATAVTFLLMAASGVYYGNRLIGYHLYWRDLWRALAASAAMVGVLWLLPLTGLIMLVIGAAVGAAVYIAVLLLVRTFSSAELHKMRQVMASFLPKSIAQWAIRP